MHYRFHSSFGVFTIRPIDGRWLLALGDEALGSYHSPEAAADDVAQCETGFFDWDDQGVVDEPESLAEWEHG